MTTTKKCANLRIVYIPLNRLVGFGENPDIRTAPNVLAPLIQLLQEDRLRVPFQVHDCPRRGIKNVVADANRRLAALRLIHHDTPDILVPCIINRDDCSTAELFARLNAANRAMNSKEWMFVWVRSNGLLPDDRVPAKVLRHLQACVNIFGSRAALEFLIEKGVAPTVATAVNRFADKIREELGTKYKLSLKRIGHWIVRHGLQADVNAICRSVISAEKLKRLYARFSSNSRFSLAEFISE
jgi:hypothetical protein